MELEKEIDVKKWKSLLAKIKDEYAGCEHVIVVRSPLRGVKLTPNADGSWTSTYVPARHAEFWKSYFPKKEQSA